MDLVVSEMYNHPEENNGVIWGFFFSPFKGQWWFSVLLAMHLKILTF